MNDQCRQCGEAIDRALRPKSPWCSPHCGYKSRYVPRAPRPVSQGTCSECAAPFEFPQTRGRPPKRCAACRQAERERQAAWRVAAHPHNRRERPCEVCGKPYRPSYYGQRTCSRAHGVELRRRLYGNANGAAIPQHNSGAVVP